MIRRAIPVLHVTNTAKALTFYHGLGFQLEFEHRDGVAVAEVRDGVWLHLSSFAGDGVTGAVANLMVDSVDSLYAEFSARDVHIEVPPVDQSWGSREMYVKDGDENCLRFIA